MGERSPALEPVAAEIFRRPGEGGQRGPGARVAVGDESLGAREYLTGGAVSSRSMGLGLPRVPKTAISTFSKVQLSGELGHANFSRAGLLAHQRMVMGFKV